MIDHAITGVAVAVFLTILAIALFLLVLPLFQRLSFDMLCQDYVRRMDAGGGLSGSQLNALGNELKQLGFTVTKLTAPPNALFGNDLTLTVQAVKAEKRVSPNLTTKILQVSYSFKRTVTCRKIITAAGEQW